MPKTVKHFRDLRTGDWAAIAAFVAPIAAIIYLLLVKAAG
jgi:hypothetical protein